MKTKLLTVFTLLIFQLYSFAGNNEESNSSVTPRNAVTGKIIDKDSGQPLEYVSIALYNTEDSTLITGT